MSIFDRARDALQGETARFIGYGAGLVVYAVARVSGAVDDIPLEAALTATAAYVTVVAGVVESIRRFVYSPRSAENLLDVIAELQEELDALRAVDGVGQATAGVEGNG